MVEGEAMTPVTAVLIGGLGGMIVGNLLIVLFYVLMEWWYDNR